MSTPSCCRWWCKRPCYSRPWCSRWIRSSRTRWANRPKNTTSNGYTTSKSDTWRKIIDFFRSTTTRKSDFECKLSHTNPTARTMIGGRWIKAIAGKRKKFGVKIWYRLTFSSLSLRFIKWKRLGVDTYGRIFHRPFQRRKIHQQQFHLMQNPSYPLFISTESVKFFSFCE